MCTWLFKVTSHTEETEKVHSKIYLLKNKQVWQFIKCLLLSVHICKHVICQTLKLEPKEKIAFNKWKNNKSTYSWVLWHDLITWYELFKNHVVHGLYLREGVTKIYDIQLKVSELCICLQDNQKIFICLLKKN